MFRPCLKGGGSGGRASGAASPRRLPQLDLAVRAEVGGASPDDDPLDRGAAVGTVLTLAPVDQELVLHGPGLPLGVAVVVDRGATEVETAFEGFDHTVTQSF